MRMKYKRCAGLGLLGWIISIPVVLIGLLILVVISFEARKAYWDYRVAEMCERDGGIKIYEKAILPKRYINNDEDVHIPAAYADKTRPRFKWEAQPDDSFYYQSETKEIHAWNPEVKKRTTKIIRSSDGKVLGKQTNYSRVGGDIPTGIMYPSSYSCRNVEGIELDIESQVFIIDRSVK